MSALGSDLRTWHRFWTDDGLTGNPPWTKERRLPAWNVLKNPKIWVDARGSEPELRARPITQPGAVKSVIEKFREKYGPKDVKKYYTRFDVAVMAALK